MVSTMIELVMRLAWDLFAIIGIFGCLAVGMLFLAYTLNRRSVRLRK